ncbi:MAG: DNA-processing protein DprA [Opitutales bacterium]
MLALNGLPQVGPIMSSHLMEAFDGDPAAIFSGPKNRLLEVPGVGEKAAGLLLQWQKHFDLDREKAHMERSGIAFVAREDASYPESLREIYDPPIGLYWKGRFSVDRPCVAIVGTRRATLYGRSIAKKFAAELSRLGFCIVSGMARGTDTAAHEGALEAGGKTIAVLGCGMDIIYPPENLELYQAIATSGAVLSEFPFGRRADRQTFPMRNRVVSGMCEAVIVIESAAAGGSMITARFAGEQGRQIMAVPGRIDQDSSAGCHQLIRDGATMVTSVDDVLEELRYARPSQMEVDLTGGELPGTGPPLEPAEQEILEKLRGGERLGIDQLSGLLQRTVAEISSLLMSLEIKRQVRKGTDGRFEAV